MPKYRFNITGIIEEHDRQEALDILDDLMSNTVYHYSPKKPQLSFKIVVSRLYKNINSKCAKWNMSISSEDDKS